MSILKSLILAGLVVLVIISTREARAAGLLVRSRARARAYERSGRTPYWQHKHLLFLSFTLHFCSTISNGRAANCVFITPLCEILQIGYLKNYTRPKNNFYIFEISTHECT